MGSELAAFPNYARGDVVRYTDHHKRPQVGQIKRIEAHWHGYLEAGAPPSIMFAITHPTYRGHVFYGGWDCIEGVA